MQLSKLLLFSVLLCVAVSLPLHAAVYYVSPEGNNNNNGRTPQTAWRNVSYATQQVGNDPSDPDSVFIFPGVYNPGAGETFPVMVRSYTALIGVDTGVVLEANSDTLPVIGVLEETAFWIENLEITEGVIGIFLKRCSDFCIYNNKIHHNLKRGVKIRNSKRFKIRENSIISNTGGGLEIDHAKRIAITGNLFALNRIRATGQPQKECTGGGISILSSKAVRISGNVVSANKLIGHSYGSSSVSVRGGGIELRSSYNITLLSNTIERNEIITSEFNSITFEERVAVEITGGGLSIFDSEVVRVKENVVGANKLSWHGDASARGRGGGIWIRNSSNITLLGNTIVANEIDIEGGLIGATSFSYGGGVYVGDSQDIQLQNNLIAGNRLYASADELAISNGGGIYVGADNVIVKQNLIEDNQVSFSGDTWAPGGGGIFTSPGVEAIIQNNIITSNHGRGYGGGLLVTGRYHDGLLIGAVTGGGNDIYGNDATSGGDDLSCFECLDTVTATFNYFAGPPEPPRVQPPDNWDTRFWRDNSILQNEPPHILSYFPTCAETTLYVGDSLLFWIESLDYDGDSTFTWWVLNGQPVAVGDSFLFIAEPQHVGYDTVQVNVTDGRAVTSHEWYLEVIGERLALLAKLSSLPKTFALQGNYPNPFNLSTVIQYQLPVDCHVHLEVYDLLGRKVATLAEGEQEAGYRSAIWEASKVSSGIYIYKLTAGDFSRVKKMMLVK